MGKKTFYNQINTINIVVLYVQFVGDTAELWDDSRGVRETSHCSGSSQ